MDDKKVLSLPTVNSDKLDVRDSETIASDLRGSLGPEKFEEFIYQTWAEFEKAERDIEADKAEKALRAKAKKCELRISGGVTWRWGIVTGHASDIMSELLAEYAETAAEIQHDMALRAKECKDLGLSESKDFKGQALMLRLGRAHTSQERTTAAICLMGFTGALQDHNPEAADLSEGDEAIKWPKLPLDDWRGPLKERLRILSVLDRGSLGSLIEIIQVHLTMASGLSEDESGN